MIVHVVLCSPPDTLSDVEREELIETLEGLRNVPGVQDFSCGVDFGGRSKGYTHVAVMRFANRDTLQGYMTDPEHLRLVDYLNRWVPDRMVIDYETESSAIST